MKETNELTCSNNPSANDRRSVVNQLLISWENMSFALNLLPAINMLICKQAQCSYPRIP